MKIAFKNEQTGRYVKDFRMVVKHVYKVDYTDDLQEAFLYNKREYLTPPGAEAEETESKMQFQIRWCREKLDQPLVPLDVMIKLSGE